MARSKKPAVTARITRDFLQRRAHDTLDALMRAARDVFAEKGFDEAQTPDIAARAGVSVGTFYRYFADKRQILVEMLAIHLQAAHDSIFSRLEPDKFAASVPGGDRRATIMAVLDVLFSHLEQFPELERVYLNMSLRDPEVARLRAAFEAKGRAALAALIESIVTRERIPDPVAAAYVIQVAAQEIALGTQGVRGLHHPEGASKVAIEEALADMIDRYLFGG